MAQERTCDRVNRLLIIQISPRCYSMVKTNHTFGNPAAHLRHPPRRPARLRKLVQHVFNGIPALEECLDGKYQCYWIRNVQVGFHGFAVIHVYLNSCKGKKRNCLYVCTNPLQPCAKLPAGSCKLRARTHDQTVPDWSDGMPQWPCRIIHKTRSALLAQIFQN